jgi:NAD+ diphosphatase
LIRPRSARAGFYSGGGRIAAGMIDGKVKEEHMSFAAGFKPPEAQPPAELRFAVQGTKVLVKLQDERLRIPLQAELPAADPGRCWVHYFGDFNGLSCWAECWPEEEAAAQGFAWKGLRELFGQMDEELVWVAGRAVHLVHWHRTHRFCGRCGQATTDHPQERAKLCPACGLINHPRLSPAIIVAVVKNRELLLAHATRFPARFYSVLAGFVEPGENLEDALRREVLEEVGLQVQNIRYFGSQPWPFPDSLMVAFTAEHAAGEIRANPAEITDAGWFAADRLPQVPPPISIARRLIDWFAANFR